MPSEKRSKAAIAFFAALDHVGENNPLIAQAIVSELKDQRKNLKMIASENYSSLAVQLAMGNLLTDKYAEGIAHHRFYAGCENIDSIEEKAATSLKELFSADHAYVQPHSGADANIVAFFAALTKRLQPKALEALHKPNLDTLTVEEFEKLRSEFVNQKLLALSLNSGGHLTHGYRHNMSSKLFQAHYYDVDPISHRFDYDEIARLAREIRPAILLAGYSSHPRKINFALMKQIAHEVGATLIVDMAHFAGLVAGKVFTGDFNPIHFGDIITSTTHKTLRGPRGGIVLCTNEYKEFVDKGCPMALGGPLPHVLAAKAVAFEEAKRPEFSQYAHRVVENARVLAETLMSLGVPVITGGTDNHMVVFSVTKWGLTGRHAETALRSCHITVNRNAIPFDTNGAWYTSGVRIGTPALTTLGLGPEEMKKIAHMIVECLTHTKPALTSTGAPSKSNALVDPTSASKIHREVESLLQNYPLYPELDLNSASGVESDATTTTNTYTK